DGVKLYEQVSTSLNTSLTLSPGSHYIAVKGWDQQGSFMSGINITVNQPPLAKLAFTPTSGVSPANVTVSTAGSSDADGSITSTTINFGDGTSATIAADGSVSHVYQAPGKYTVTATLTDNEGATGSASASLKILAPYVTISSPQAGATPASPVRVVAAGFSGNPVSKMMIYVDTVPVYTAYSAKI